MHHVNSSLAMASCSSCFNAFELLNRSVQNMWHLFKCIHKQESLKKFEEISALGQITYNQTGTNINNQCKQTFLWTELEKVKTIEFFHNSRLIRRIEQK